MKSQIRITVALLLWMVSLSSIADDDENTRLFNAYNQLTKDSTELGEIIKAASAEQYNRAKVIANCSLENLGTNAAQNPLDKMNEASHCVKSIKTHLAKIISTE